MQRTRVLLFHGKGIYALYVTLTLPALLSLGSSLHDRFLPRPTRHRFITTGSYTQSVSNFGALT